MKINISFVLKFVGVALMIAAAYFGILPVRLTIAAGGACYAAGYFYAKFKAYSLMIVYKITNTVNGKVYVGQTRRKEVMLLE